MRVHTVRFGVVEVPPEEILTFPQGILGFPDYKEYFLMENPDSYFSFLQSIEEPSLTFVLIAPELLRPDYQVVLNKEQREELQLQEATEGRVLAIVTVPENIADMTANLQAPLVINMKKKLGKQVILADGTYQIRHNVLAEFQQAEFIRRKQQEQTTKLRKTV